MSTRALSDTRSPWYETFLHWRQVWAVSSEPPESPEPPADGRSEAPDVSWVTEAIFDSYNELGPARG